jgi:hypothetical protein
MLVDKADDFAFSGTRQVDKAELEALAFGHFGGMDDVAEKSTQRERVCEVRVDQEGMANGHFVSGHQE